MEPPGVVHVIAGFHPVGETGGSFPPKNLN